LVSSQPLQNTSLPKTGRETKAGATGSWFNFSISISFYFLAWFSEYIKLFGEVVGNRLDLLTVSI